MQILEARSALLSNYEVFELLKEQESDYLARTKTALRVKKEEADHIGDLVSVKPPPPAGGKDPSALPEISENMRTLQVQAIEYLSASYQPTSQQTASGITHLIKTLQPYDLTKAEKLQIVNLVPRAQVEVYVIIEELEDRLGEKMGEIIELITSTIPLNASATATTTTIIDTSSPSNDHMHDSPDNLYVEGDEEQEFDDTGEGAGVEGDLDMNED